MIPITGNQCETRNFATRAVQKNAGDVANGGWAKPSINLSAAFRRLTGLSGRRLCQEILGEGGGLHTPSPS